MTRPPRASRFERRGESPGPEVPETSGALWDAIFATPDPWSSGDLYERTKHGHTLELLPHEPLATALEIGCAEGRMTAELAPKVRRLVAIDISTTALDRARERCAKHGNVEFVRDDAFRHLPDETFDLVLCTEMLYYARNRFALRAAARRLAARVRGGGHLLIAHAHCVADRRNETGFDFHEIGAEFIGSAFARVPGLRLVRELRTELYQVQLFRKRARAGEPQPPLERTIRRVSIADADRVRGLVKWHGCDVTDAEARHFWRSPEIPILMYHRIAADGPASLAPYRVAPDNFERQLAHLQRQGYRSISIEEAVLALSFPGSPPAGRLVSITFDDAYTDFVETAWPLLRDYGFSATVFVPTAHVAGRADWDREHGEPAPLANWSQLRRAFREGCQVGSHGASHRRLTELSATELEHDLRTSKATIERELGFAPDLLSYPSAAVDGAVRQAASDAGFRFATVGEGWLGPEADPLLLPRQEILGNFDQASFVARLGPGGRATLAARMRYRWLRLLRDRRTYMSD